MKTKEIEVNSVKTEVFVDFHNALPYGYGHYKVNGAAQEAFKEIKEAVIELWKEKDNTFGYVTEKLRRIEHIENVRDNAWYMVAMFDRENQAKLLQKVSPETRLLIIDSLSS